MQRLRRFVVAAIATGVGAALAIAALTKAVTGTVQAIFEGDGSSYR